MADILLNRILNEEIPIGLFLKWLTKTDSQAQYFEGFIDSGCSRTDFLTYFLNFVHEEVPCANKNDSPQKTKSSKRIEPVNCDEDCNKPTINALDKTFDETDSIKITPNVSRSTSTPKIPKLQQECNVSNGYPSPISPLYREQNSFTTPKNKRQIFTLKSAEHASPLCLGDFIVNKRSSGKKKASRSLIVNKQVDEASKRIKPTSLSQVKVNNSFRQTENSFNKFQDTKEVSVDSVGESRNFLAEERLKILSRRNSKDNVAVSNKAITSFMNFKTEVEPDLKCVTNLTQLDHLVEIYVVILRRSLVLNITSEIHFLISLILSKQFRERDNSSDEFHLGVDFLNEDDRGDLQGVISAKRKVSGLELFDSVHNIVYFAVRCLESQLDVLKYYDKSTLKLLAQNMRLRSFSGGFSEKLAKIAEKKPDRVLELVEDDLQTNVCFNLDTDNRENFPTEFSFHAFRKQRDLFYEILRIWENHHMLTGWNFAMSLGGKIKGLFSLQSEPANFMHFSRLFKAQLVCTCAKTQKEEGMSASQVAFLTSLPNVDADKLNRLKSRLVTKQASSGINSLPVFTGHQEFYKDFIVVASNYTFNKHLCDTLVAEIVELNDTKFICTDLDETDSDVDPSTRKAYVACLRSLRVLAKFLGFVEALPYKSDSGYSDSLLTSHLNVRQQSTPAFDIKAILEEALHQGNVVVTVSWVAKYLSMLDYVALRLPYYVAVHKILFKLYRSCELATLSRKGYNYNVTLLKLTLGWLFELPHFPDSEYFNFCTATLGDVSKKFANGVKRGKTLDDLDIVDQNALYAFCPYLEEIKKLLTSNVTNSNVTVKHITPVTAEQSSNEVAKKRLELQLEEAFFNGQPVSVRKTVEFVSERVASSCVKHICNVIVPSFRKTALAELKSFLANWALELDATSPLKEKSHKAVVKTKATKMAQANLKALKVTCEAEVSDIAKAKIPPSIENLLAIDTLAQTKAVCVSLTVKLCIDRVKQWINSHVTLSVFTKDFDAELKVVLSPETRKIVKEKPLFALPPGGNEKKHNDESMSAVHLLEKLKGFSVDILENHAQIDEEIVSNILEDAYITLTERCDVNDCIMTSACTLLVDISLLLITHNSRIMANDDVLSRLVRLWRCYYGKISDLFRNLLCPRNVMLFAQSTQERSVWDSFAMFVAFLIKENLLPVDGFESQCTGFFKKDWDQMSLKNFTGFLRTFIDCYRSNGGSVVKFTLLLDFLSDFCTDL